MIRPFDYLLQRIATLIQRIAFDFDVKAEQFSDLPISKLLPTNYHHATFNFKCYKQGFDENHNQQAFDQRDD